MQIPHCTAPVSRNAFCKPEREPAFIKPSTVVISEPSTCPAPTRQAQQTSPSSITVQAPQSPALHPTLVPLFLAVHEEHELIYPWGRTLIQPDGHLV